MATTTGNNRRPLYELVINGHRSLLDRLRALRQAGHDGYDPEEIERVRAVVWAIHSGEQRR